MLQSAAIHPDKVAIYVRWSTDEQTDGTTAQVQLEACRAFITSQGWRSDPQLTFVDDGYSGSTLDRPAMSQLRQRCREGQVDCVVVFKLDRLSRSVLDTVTLVLKEWGDRICLKSAREPIDTSTAMGKQFFYLLISYAEWERNVIRERTMGGRLKRSQEGKHLTKPPFGYALGAAPGERVVVPEEAAIVRQMFEQYVGGMGDRQIAAWLNGHGLRTRQGKLWHPNTVKNLLTNALYAGTVRFGHKSPGSLPGGDRARGYLVESDSAAPALVDRALFLQAQAVRSGQAAKLAGRAAASPHLLTGLLRCRCGSSLQFKQINNKARAQNGQQFGYYLCSRKFAHGAAGCDSGFLPVAAVDTAVVSAFLNRLGPLSARAAELAHRLGQMRRAGHDQPDALRTEAERLRKSLSRLDQDYLAGQLPARRYDALRARAEEALANAEAQLQQRNPAEAAHTANQRALLARVKHMDHWADLTVQERKELLAIFLESVVVWRPIRRLTWDCEIRWRGPANKP